MNFTPISCKKPLFSQVKKRKRRTLLEQSELVRLWQKSDVVESVFCRENGINAKAFGNWLAREKKLNSKKVKQQLPESAKREFVDSSAKRLNCELLFPNGVLLTLLRLNFLLCSH